MKKTIHDDQGAVVVHAHEPIVADMQRMIIVNGKGNTEELEELAVQFIDAIEAVRVECARC
ncbi:MAG: hypothetical protein IPK99_12025 [Flavobacteriales bacterium]|nr:hypothetical protein [Flavobacteriales bacterium]